MLLKVVSFRPDPTIKDRLSIQLNYTKGNGGGGSGRVVEAKLDPPPSLMVVTVGAAGQDSALQDGADGADLLRAERGGDGHGDGGDGYSGGGACYSAVYGDGGTDGSDGCCGGYGGSGSGLSLATFSLQSFSLMPGAAGIKHDHIHVVQMGGGGGGVLVDGAGPQDLLWDGQGYGGGQGGYYEQVETPGSAGPGIVLMEIGHKRT